MLPLLPSDVRKQVNRLYSKDAVERGWGAYHLGNMGKKAAPATPYLIGILGDRAALEWRPFFPSQGFTSPSEEAEDALVKIGKPAVEPLIAALKDENSNVRKRAARALGEIKVP